ncbi:MAG: hypothetical protein HN627_01665 [Opitutae bacterium]|nr:hypothetical protein [Opitutae bacterium]
MLTLSMHSRFVALLPMAIFMGLSTPVDLIHAQEDGNFTDEMLEELLFGKGLEEVVEKKPSQWSKTLNLSIGGGHGENPLQSPGANIQEGGFATASVDTFLLRMGKNGGVFYVYLYGEGFRYPDIPALDLTGIALAQAEYSMRSPTTGNVRGIRFRHTYYDMVFDDPDNPKTGYPIQSNKSEIRPFVTFPIGEGLTGGFEVSAARDTYASNPELYNYHEKEFRSIVKWKGDEDVSVNFSMYSRWKDYDGRQGFMNDGTSVDSKTRTVGTGISGTRKFGKGDDWEVNLSAYFNKTTDNANGYYDYESLSGSLKVTREIGPWTLSASVNGSYSSYDSRPVLDENWNPTGEFFQRNGLSTEFEADRKINEKWNLFAKWKKERDDSNDSGYEYEATMFSAGIKWSH